VDRAGEEVRSAVPRLVLTALLAAAAAAQTPDPVRAALAKSVIDPKQPLVEVQVYTAARTPPLPTFRTASEWKAYSSALRKRVLDEVVLRGQARAWSRTPLRAEWSGTIRGGSDYEIRKVRLEAVPGLWVPGLLYRPLEVHGKVPAVLNVNGHEKTGNSTPYIQERCIHLARSGVLALNLEWFGRGQMSGAGFDHARMPQIDLTGTSGVAVHYLAQRKGLDLLESLPETDRARIAVTGLSGGGWQTIFISALDERVAAANPVAGYSSFVTRAQWPELDMGDAEQTPSDLAAVADYTHLTALLAPRWAQLANNAFDSCCFRADYALGPLVQAGRGAYALLGVPQKLRYHINFGKGHNYDEDNREAFYRLLRDAFFGGRDFPIVERPLESPVRAAADLAVELPADNLDFHSLALRLAEALPRREPLPREAARKRLRSVVRTPEYNVDARAAGSATEGNITVRYWRLKMGGAWTVPAVELEPAGAKASVIVVADAGRQSAAAQVQELLGLGARVLAVDPFYFGESKIAARDYLFAILIAALGERPLGVQSGQIMAAARWLQRERGGEVRIAAFGPRTSLAALIAAALEERAIAGLSLHQPFSSLKDILTQDLVGNRAPELFCFGLLEAFDIPAIQALVAPRAVDLVK
jgi:dienelactone hydrolase